MTTGTPDDGRTPVRRGVPPSPTEAFGHAWHQLKHAFLPLLGVTFGWLLVTSVAGRNLSGLPHLLFQVLFAGPVGIGAAWAALRVARGETPEFGDLFAAFRRDWAQASLLCLLLGLAVGTGLALLVLPGVWIGLRLSWAPYLFMDEGLGAAEALRESFRRTRGHATSLLWLWTIAGLVTLAGLVLFVVGVLPASMWAQTAAASYYLGARDA
ncbi:MAG: hypothetical protein ACKO2K_10460 [Alphaproteobacteria bacterium]